MQAFFSPLAPSLSISLSLHNLTYISPSQVPSLSRSLTLTPGILSLQSRAYAHTVFMATSMASLRAVKRFIFLVAPAAAAALKARLCASVLGMVARNLSCLPTPLALLWKLVNTHLGEEESLRSITLEKECKIVASSMREQSIVCELFLQWVPLRDWQLLTLSGVIFESPPVYS